MLDGVEPRAAANIQPLKMRLISPCSVSSSTSMKPNGRRRPGRRPRIAGRGVLEGPKHRLVDRHIEADDAAGDLVWPENTAVGLAISCGGGSTMVSLVVARSKPASFCLRERRTGRPVAGGAPVGRGGGSSGWVWIRELGGGRVAATSAGRNICGSRTADGPAHRMAGAAAGCRKCCRRYWVTALTLAWRRADRNRQQRTE